MVTAGTLSAAVPLEIEQAVAANYPRLTTVQRQVIDRLLADTRYGAVVSASTLAAAIGTSESTVTRAAQALGFAGFPDLQSRLRAEFFRPVQERIALDAAPAAEPMLRARQTMLTDAANIREMAEDLAAGPFLAAVEALETASRVVVFGERGSHGLAVMLGIGLRLVLPGVTLLSQANGDLPDQLIGLGPGDVVVVVSFRRVDRTSVLVLRRANQVGAQTIAMTDHLSSAVARHARHTLIARIGQLRLIPSFAAGASLVNALLAEVAVRTHEQAGERLREAETLWTEFEAYSKL